MSTSSKENGEASQPKPSTSQVLFMFGTMADTTWRMFVPIIGLTFIGIWADNSLHTKPWMTVIGIILGTMVAGLLIKQQLQRDKK